MDELSELIPHRDPFLFVDEIEYAAADQVIGYKTYGDSFDIFQGHYSDNQIVPGTILIESMAQCGGAGLRKAQLIGDDLMGLAAIDNANFLRTVVKGDRVRMVIKNVRIGSRVVKQSGVSFVRDNPVVEAEWMCARMNSTQQS